MPDAKGTPQRRKGTRLAGLRHFWTGVNSATEFLCGGCLVLIAAFTIYEIVCRYVFGSPTLWTQDFSIYLMIWCTFLGLMATDRAGQHIRIDVWLRQLSTKSQLIIGIIAYAFVAVFAAIATWTSGEMVAQSIRFHRQSLSLVPVPMWIPQSALTVGLGLFFLECLRRAIAAIIVLRTGSQWTSY